MEGEWITANDSPDNGCFGCSPHNDRGLRLRFRRVGKGEVEAPYQVAAHFCGAPNVVHGGVQAALLDEAMGFAVHEGSDEEIHVVTAELRLRYRRPVPGGVPLRIRARFLRSEGDDYYVEGEIVGADGSALTRGESRWRRVTGPGQPR
jgi:uncharacterized protein (TIGR00369 family)